MPPVYNRKVKESVNLLKKNNNKKADYGIIAHYIVLRQLARGRSLGPWPRGDVTWDGRGPPSSSRPPTPQSRTPPQCTTWHRRRCRTRCPCPRRGHRVCQAM